MEQPPTFSAEPFPSPQPYRIEMTGLVERELEALEDRAFAAGFGQQFSDAIDGIFRILRIYPQYGEILRELKQGEAVYTSRAFTIPPLFVEYIIDEPNHRVFIVTPFKAMPHVGFQ